MRECALFIIHHTHLLSLLFMARLNHAWLYLWCVYFSIYISATAAAHRWLPQAALPGSERETQI
jgi:hypothetical protein